MISPDAMHIVSPEICCGCGACEQTCPIECISIVKNSEGFHHPIRDAKECIKCGACENVCPVLNKEVRTNQYKDRQPTAFFGRNNDSTILNSSSSGGVFSVFAKIIIDMGGVVFGASFDSNWDVNITYSESLDGLNSFRGSKYVEARVGNSYIKAKEFLDNGRWVLFCSTPCQIAGLLSFLGKPYERLLAIEIMCHAVPSSKVWQLYLHDVCGNKTATAISFRSKTFGWNKYGIKISSGKDILIDEPNDKNIYLRGFISGLFNRRSCSSCPARGFSSGCDITIGDFWELDDLQSGIKDNKGMSAIMALTDKGSHFIAKARTNCELIEIPSNVIILSQYHSTLTKSAPLHPNRDLFFQEINNSPRRNTRIIRIIKKNLTPSVKETVKRQIKLAFQVVWKLREKK